MRGAFLFAVATRGELTQERGDAELLCARSERPRARGMLNLLATPPLLLGAGHYANVANVSLAELRRLSEMHLRPPDLNSFERVTGESVASLLADSPEWRATNKKLMARIMGIHKVVAHPLNARGLHVLRSLLSERMADHVRHARGSTDHPLYERFMNDGVLVFPDVQNVSATLDGLFSARDRQVEAVLRMVSGFRRLGASSFIDWSPHTHFATDPQFYMHVDTYHPTWKIFVFQKTTLEQGPLHYVYGSHRNSEGNRRRYRAVIRPRLFPCCERRLR